MITATWRLHTSKHTHTYIYIYITHTHTHIYIYTHTVIPLLTVSVHIYISKCVSFKGPNSKTSTSMRIWCWCGPSPWGSCGGLHRRHPQSSRCWSARHSRCAWPSWLRNEKHRSCPLSVCRSTEACGWRWDFFCWWWPPRWVGMGWPPNQWKLETKAW